MPFVVTCTGCQKKLKIPDALIGKSAKCPGCARKLNTSVATQSAADQAARSKAVGNTPTTKTPAAPKRTAAPTRETSSPAALKKPTPAKSKPTSAKSAAKPKRTAKPPPAASPAKRTPTPRRAGGGIAVFILAGSAGVGTVLVGLAAWYFFFSGPSLYDVSGKVTLDGQPMDKVTVKFIAIDAASPSSVTKNADTDQRGTYRLTSAKGKALPAGSYKVVISKMVLLNGEDIADGEYVPKLIEEGKTKNRFAEVYGTPEKSILRAVVKAGANNADFDLKAHPDTDQDAPPPPMK